MPVISVIIDSPSTTILYEKTSEEIHPIDNKPFNLTIFLSYSEKIIGGDLEIKQTSINLDKNLILNAKKNDVFGSNLGKLLLITSFLSIALIWHFVSDKLNRTKNYEKHNPDLYPLNNKED